MTVISAQDDRALWVSAGLAGGNRVGRADAAALEKLGLKVVDASGMGGFLRHDTFMADTGVQKIIAQAIADARSGSMDHGPSLVPEFQRNLPVTQRPLPPPSAPLPGSASAPATAPAPATVSTPPVTPAPLDAPVVEATPIPAPAQTTSPVY
jgi:hypothetical protein